MAFSRTVAHATAADGTFSAAGVLAWDGVGAHTPAVTDATSGGIPYFSSTTAEASSALLAQYGVVIGGGAGAAPATQSGLTFGGSAAGTGLAIAAGTATTNNNANALNISQTWNAAGVTFAHEKHVITDTASAAGSLALQYLGGAAGTTNLLSVNKDGLVTTGSSVVVGGNVTVNYGTYGFYNGVDSSAGYVFGAAYDANLSRISAGLIGVGTGAAGSFAGGLKLTDLTINRAATFLTTSVALTDGAGASVGTLTNAPAATNPTKWIGINDNGTVRYIPSW